MALGVDDYRGLLFSLLPPGMVWPAAADSNFQGLLAGLAKEPARVDDRIEKLLAEADPRQADALFPEWEASFGLPDECMAGDQSMADRRISLIGRVVGRGGMRSQDYVDMADGLGYEGLEIVEHAEATMELASGAGPRGAEIGDAMTGESWLYAWDALIPSGVVRTAVIDSAEIGDPLRSWGDNMIECVLHRAAPSWLYLNVGYKEA